MASSGLLERTQGGPVLEGFRKAPSSKKEGCVSFSSSRRSDALCNWGLLTIPSANSFIVEGRSSSWSLMVNDLEIRTNFFKFAEDEYHHVAIPKRKPSLDRIESSLLVLLLG